MLFAILTTARNVLACENVITTMTTLALRLLYFRQILALKLIKVYEEFSLCGPFHPLYM